MQDTFHEQVIVGALDTNCWIAPLADTAAADTAAADTDRAPAAVIDPGADAGEIIAALALRGLYPKYILLTHGHFDHISALPALVRHFSGGGGRPLVAVSREDSLYLGPNSLAAHRDSFSAAAGNTRYIDSLWEPMPEADIILKDGDTVAGFTALHLPGHTEGSMGFLDEAGRRLYSGDTLFRAGVGRTDLPGGDRDALLASLRRLFALDGRIRVYPGHGASTTIEAERR